MAGKRASKKGNKWVSVVVFVFVVAYLAFSQQDNTEVVQNNYSAYNEKDSSYEVTSDLEIYVFDVGQADSILISNSGEYMLIDAGNNKDGKLIVKELNELGIKKIDYLIGTHPHEDHIGGLDDVIENFDIGTIYMPKRQADTKTFEDILDIVSKKKLKITSPKPGDIFNIGEAKCKVISADANASDTNDSSVVIELCFGSKKYLFTGDIGEAIESACEWEDIDVLKVAHHGSRYSSTKEFLNSTKPEIAIISTGLGNDYGHPHKEALTRLEATKAKIYRTDEDGTIYIKSDGDNISIECLDICLDGN